MEYGYIAYAVRELPVNVLGGSFVIISYIRKLNGKSIHCEIKRYLFNQFPQETVEEKEFSFDSQDITTAPVELTMELILDQVAEITRHDIAAMLTERSKDMVDSTIALLPFTLEKHYDLKELLTSFLMRGVLREKIEVLKNITPNKLLQQDLEKILNVNVIKTIQKQFH